MTQVAERGRFELPVRYKPTHAFQACALNHSAIAPASGFTLENGLASRKAAGENTACFPDGRLLYCTLFFERKSQVLCDVQKALKRRNRRPNGSRLRPVARSCARAPGAGT